ncbi:MAG: IclR family transcriptional regulator [Syntrophorhabdales bacterium]|jgi:DNA-binding IclR family transcriptional regulator
MQGVRKDAFYNRSLERALRIVTAFTNERRSMTLAQLSEVLDLSKATVSRLCSTLVDFGFLHQDHDVKQYSLGIRLFELGTIVASSFSLSKAASPFLAQLAMKLRRSVFLGILDNGELLYIDKREDLDGPITFMSSIGRRRPPYWGMVGQVMMAYLPKDEIDRMIDKNPLAPTTKKSFETRKELDEFLGRVREQGFAIDDGRVIEGVGGVAAPIRDFTGKVVAGLGVGFIFSSVDAREMKEITKAVVQTARAISREVGYTGKDAGN